MKLSHIKAMTAKNLNQMKRDPRMIILAIIAPIIVTTLFGFVFGGELTDLKVYVVCEDENFDDIIGSDIVNTMAQDTTIEFNTTTSNPVVGKSNDSLLKLKCKSLKNNIFIYLIPY